GSFTRANLIAASGSASTMHTAACQIDVDNSGKQRVVVPVVIGLPFTSEGETTGPDSLGDVPGTKGPILGEYRRVHRYAVSVVNTTTDAAFGSQAGSTYAAQFQSNGSTVAAGTAFTGVHQDTLKDDYSFNGAIYWKNASPYPMPVPAVTAMLEVNET